MRQNIDTIVVIVVISAAIFIIAVLIMCGYSMYTDYRDNKANTIPEAPSGLNITSKTSSEISLIWHDEADNEIGYRVYRDGLLIVELAKDVGFYTDYEIASSTLYDYSVVAYNNAGESIKANISTKSSNPGIIVVLDKIGVNDNGEDDIRDAIDGHGEIYLGVVVTDGISTQVRRLPADGFYFLADNSDRQMNSIIFSTSSVGEFLDIRVVGLEHDYGGLGDDLLIEALNYALMGSMGTIPSLILSAANVDFTEEITEIGGFRDDYLGEYNYRWTASDNWGTGVYYFELDKGNNMTGLKLWFTIKSTE